MSQQAIIAGIVQRIRDTIECELSGSCRFASQDMTVALIAAGIKDFQVVEGYVRQPGNRYTEQHTWIKVGGQILDPTFVQFAEGSAYAGIKRSYTPGEYQIPHPKDVELETKYPNYRQQYYKAKPGFDME
jgi:hypothetical protein